MLAPLSLCCYYAVMRLFLAPLVARLTGERFFRFVYVDPAAGLLQFCAAHPLFAVSALLARAAEPFAIGMELRGQQLQVEASGNVRCDPAWTAEALGNILKNCSEHMQAGWGLFHGRIRLARLCAPLWRRLAARLKNFLPD